MLFRNRKLFVLNFALILALLGGMFGVVSVQASAVIHVKWNASGANNGTSWADAYTDLQSALSAAISGDEIWVTAGTYKPTTGIDRTVSFTLKIGVAIYGGFAGTETLLTQRDPATNVTILSGDIGIMGDNSDNSYHVVIGSSENNSAILDGVTITAGNANSSMYSSDQSKGGGMYNDKGSPTLMNIIFNGNYATFGGGMYNGGEYSYPNGSNPILTNVIFNANSAIEGGGIRNENYSNPILTNVTFSGNSAVRSGGGMENFHYGSPILTNVTFSGNTGGAGGGGIINWSSSSPILTNVTFNVNSATDWGGGIYNDNGSNPSLKNVTFSGNQASQGGGMYNAYGSDPSVTNSILYSNPGGEIFDVSGTRVVNYSIVQGGYPGTGNLDVNPLVGPLQNNGGFTQTMALGVGSPAINAGDDATCATTDQRGVTRPQGSHCDIGAYEYEPGIQYVKWNANGANNGTSWMDAYTNLQSALAAAISGDEIWVAAGTYKPTTGIDRTVSFTLKIGVAIYGGFIGTETALDQRDAAANVTMLSGDIGVQGNNSDNSYHVVVGNNTNTTAVLDGFIITDGNANGTPPFNNGGGGMLNDGGSPRLTNVTIRHNSAEVGGGIANWNSNPVLVNITFIDNTASALGGGLYNGTSSPSG